MSGVQNLVMPSGATMTPADLASLQQFFNATKQPAAGDVVPLTSSPDPLQLGFTTPPTESWRVDDTISLDKATWSKSFTARVVSAVATAYSTRGINPSKKFLKNDPRRVKAAVRDVMIEMAMGRSFDKLIRIKLSAMNKNKTLQGNKSSNPIDCDSQETDKRTRLFKDKLKSSDVQVKEEPGVASNDEFNLEKELEVTKEAPKILVQTPPKILVQTTLPRHMPSIGLMVSLRNTQGATMGTGMILQIDPTATNPRNRAPLGVANVLVTVFSVDPQYNNTPVPNKIGSKAEKMGTQLGQSLACPINQLSKISTEFEVQPPTPESAKTMSFYSVWRLAFSSS